MELPETARVRIGAVKGAVPGPGTGTTIVPPEAAAPPETPPGLPEPTLSKELPRA